MSVASTADTRFRLSTSQALALAKEFGTPLYVVDESHFRNRIRRYQAAFKAATSQSELNFASKANSTVALLAIAYSEGCKIDVASEGELRAALKAGVPASECHFHGNNKRKSEIEFAIESGIGHIVADHFSELEMLATIDRLGGTKIVLRLAPGVDPVTHSKISTGQADTKFGFNIADGSAEAAVKICLEKSLPLIGFHCHVGSQLLDPEAQRTGGSAISGFAVRMKNELKFSATYLNIGGGLGVHYTDSDTPMGIENYCRLVCETIHSELENTGIDPTIAQEPGRSLIAESGVSLYQVGVIKTVPTGSGAHRTYVCVDGGLSDNPRPALYGSRYDLEFIANSEVGSGRTVSETRSRWVETAPFQELKDLAESDGARAPSEANALQETLVTISGAHCETDKLFENVPAALDVAEGDLVQVFSTGAYNSSMASNYNRFRRPTSILIRPNGQADVIQRTESWDELLARDVSPSDLNL